MKEKKRTPSHVVKAKCDEADQNETPETLAKCEAHRKLLQSSQRLTHEQEQQILNDILYHASFWLLESARGKESRGVMSAAHLATYARDTLEIIEARGRVADGSTIRLEFALSK